ncbi:lachesin-like [Daphnia pulicaria]|uniref:lachesin-like n=1 Tax=Daphnia pulicaria TaxID=35523 RepID=UPI001EEB16FA|nr:lachesin-like [Daphnia pulicaria]
MIRMDWSASFTSRWTLPFILLPWLFISMAETESRYLPEFERPLPNQTVTLGAEAVLSCHVAHLGGYKVGWIKSDSKAIQAIHTHVITHNTRVSVRHFGHSVWQLVIADVQREDEGLFMCQINTDPMKSQVAYLRVVVPPEIEPTDSGTNDVMTSEGSSIKLGCKAKGDPTPVVRWHREDGEDITMRTVNGERLRFATYEGETLSLIRISRLDMGIYVCTASNGIPPAASRRIAVNINFNPVINVPNQLIWSTQGNNFTMECNVEAFPRSVNYWIRGDGELIISGSKFGVSEVRDSIFASRMALTVHSFEKSDIGKYRCIAKNSLGEVEGRIHVYESNSWPAARATTKRSIDYAEDLEETNNGLDHNQHHRQQQQQRRQQQHQDNEVDDLSEGDDDEEEHQQQQQQGDGLSAAPAGRDTLHYQLTTTEKSAWRSGHRNGSAGSLHFLPLLSSTSFVCVLSLVLSLPHFIPFCRYI